MNQTQGVPMIGTTSRPHDSNFHQWNNFVTVYSQCKTAFNYMPSHTASHKAPDAIYNMAWYANYIHEWGDINMLLLHQHTASGTQPSFFCAPAAELGTSQSISRLMNAVAHCFIPMSANVWHLVQQDGQIYSLIAIHKRKDGHIWPTAGYKYFSRWLWTLCAFSDWWLLEYFRPFWCWVGYSVIWCFQTFLCIPPSRNLVMLRAFFPVESDKCGFSTCYMYYIVD